MATERIHRAISSDGTEIAGRVRGQGPPLVLVQSSVHDGEWAWEALLPHLTDRFTCYLPSLRGRGSSGDSPDHSPPRFQEDIDAFVDSVGEPVLLVGWSDGANLALGAAARSGGVAAVAAYEPGVYTLMREDDFARFGSAIKQQMEAGGYPKLRRPLTNQAEGRNYSYPRPMKAAPLKPEGFPVPPHG